MKSQHELEIFAAFAAEAELSIDPTSVRSCRPPHPDIYCTISGAPTYFELGRLLDKNVPGLLIDGIKAGPTLRKPSKKRIGIPEREILRQKLTCSYLSDGAPIHLLLYYDNPIF